MRSRKFEPEPEPAVAELELLDSILAHAATRAGYLRCAKDSEKSSDCNTNRCDRESANRELSTQCSHCPLQPQRSIAAMHLIALLLAGAAALKPLTGRVALVTGASRGIGKGIAL